MFRSLGRKLGFPRLPAGFDPGHAALQALRAAGAALLASDCPCCRQPMGWGRYGVCAWCWEELAPLAGRGCLLCGGGLSHPDADEPSRCAGCRERAAPFFAVTAYGAYSGRLQELIHALKFHGRPRLAGPLGRIATEGLRAAGMLDRAADAAIVAVPLSRQRLARRGYNQSELIARAVRKTLLLETRGRPEMARALRKIVETSPQAGRSRSERLRAPSGAYATTESGLGPIAGRRVLLVDDVFTTGATAAECSRVLLEAGADEIIVAVVARTMGGTGGRK